MSLPGWSLSFNPESDVCSEQLSRTTHYSVLCLILGVFVKLVSKVMGSPVWHLTRVLHPTEVAAA